MLQNNSAIVKTKKGFGAVLHADTQRFLTSWPLVRLNSLLSRQAGEGRLALVALVWNVIIDTAQSPALLSQPALCDTLLLSLIRLLEKEPDIAEAVIQKAFYIQESPKKTKTVFVGTIQGRGDTIDYYLYIMTQLKAYRHRLRLIQHRAQEIEQYKAIKGALETKILQRRPLLSELSNVRQAFAYVEKERLSVWRQKVVLVTAENKIAEANGLLRQIKEHEQAQESRKRIIQELYQNIKTMAVARKDLKQRVLFLQTLQQENKTAYAPEEIFLNALSSVPVQLYLQNSSKTVAQWNWQD